MSLGVFLSVYHYRGFDSALWVAFWKLLVKFYKNVTPKTEKIISLLNYPVAKVKMQKIISYS